MWILKCEWICTYGGTGTSIEGYAKTKKEIIQHLKDQGLKYSTQYKCWVERNEDYSVKFWYTPVKIEKIGK